MRSSLCTWIILCSLSTGLMPIYAGEDDPILSKDQPEEVKAVPPSTPIHVPSTPPATKLQRWTSATLLGLSSSATPVIMALAFREQYLHFGLPLLSHGLLWAGALSGLPISYWGLMRKSTVVTPADQETAFKRGFLAGTFGLGCAFAVAIFASGA